MRTIHIVVAGILLAVALGASGLAVYYKIRATQYQNQYMDAMLRMEGETNRERAPAEANNATTSFQEPERQYVANEIEVDMAARVRELEEALARRDRDMADPQDRITPQEPAEEEQAPRERRDWLGDLRENDPERYDAIMQRRDEARQRMRESFARKAAHFLNRDTEAMEEQERVEYEFMLGLLGETWELSDQLQQEGLSREERGELRGALARNIHDLRPMLEAERDREFFDLGRQLGYDEAGATQFVDYIHEMLDITSFSGMWGRGGPGRGRGPAR